MRSNQANPERNSGQRLTINARVINTKEAYALYHQGHVVDRMAGYYEQQGYLEPDFYMMDKVSRLQALNRYRQMMQDAREKQKTLEADLQVKRAEEALKAQQAEDDRLAAAIARMSQSKTE